MLSQTPDHNIIVFPQLSSDGPLLQAVPDTKKARRKLASKNVAIGIRHFTIDEKMGVNPVLHCWCGESLVMNYRTGSEADVDAMSAKLSAFVNDHAECTAKGCDA